MVYYLILHINSKGYEHIYINARETVSNSKFSATWPSSDFLSRLCNVKDGDIAVFEESVVEKGHVAENLELRDSFSWILYYLVLDLHNVTKYLFILVL